MNERLKKLRKTLDLTQQKFADRIGVKQNTIAQYEMGRNIPIDSVVSLICREFNVNEAWLREGTGEMFALIEKETKYHSMVDRIMKGEHEHVKNVFKAFTTFDESDWDALDRMIEKYSAVAFGETATTLFSDVPDTPEELERRFPPVEHPDKTNNAG